MKFQFIYYFILFNLKIYSQVVFVNNGQDIVFNDNVQFIVNGDLANDVNGFIKNKGFTYVKGDLINNATIEGGNSESKFYVLKNWENNSIFSPFLSTVYLDGVNQSIRGTKESHFNNLFLENISTKTLEIDCSVSGVLNLNNSELATTDYKMFISNAEIDALQFIENFGFVSSEGDGRLVRNTNSTNSYIFPTGENIGTLKYRPIRIQPKSSNLNQFEVRFVNSNAEFDGYDFDIKDSRIKYLNEGFYHLIRQSYGNDKSKLNIYYNPSEDGNWIGISKWDNKWLNIGETTLIDYAKLKEISFSNWSEKDNEAHILVNLETCKLAVPTGFSPNSSKGKNDGFGALKSCELSYYKINIFNRWGELIFSSTDINKQWDGTYKGYNVDMGAYTWLMDYSLEGENDIKQEKGSVTLIK